MSRKKKLFMAGLLCGIVMAASAQPDAAWAASLSASADIGSAAKGEYVNVSVNLSGNPSISTLGTALSYDSSVLKYDSSTWNGGFSGSDMQMASDTGSEVNLSVVCDDSYSADGTVVTVRFQAVKDTSSIPVTLSLREMADADLAAVSDCQVASAVKAPQPADKPAANELEDDEIVDLEDPNENAGVSIVDEESDPAGAADGDGASSDNNSAPGQTSEDKQNGTWNGSGADSSTAGNTGSGTDHASGNGTDGSMQIAQGESDTQMRMAAANESDPSRLDLNYKTGGGIGNDIYLIGAAVFGILALVLVLKHTRS